MKWVTGLVLLLFFWCSPCFGGQTDSYLEFPASGASVYVLDNPALEQSGVSYFAAGVRYQPITVTAAALRYLIARGNPTSSSFGLNLDTAGRAIFYTNSGITDFNLTHNSISSSTVPNTAVGQAKFDNLGACESKIWFNGSSKTDTTTGVRDLLDTTNRLSIASAHDVNTRNFPGKIYSAWIAYADIPIITADSNVTNWSRDPGVYPLPFSLSGVSRAFVWDATGARNWVNGQWTDSDKSLTLTYAGVTAYGANVAAQSFLHSTGNVYLNSQWSKLQGQRVTLTDSAGKVAYGYVGTAGTAEALGSELNTTANATSDPNANEANGMISWNSYGSTIASGVTASGASVGSYALYVRPMLSQYGGMWGGNYSTVASGLYRFGGHYRATASSSIYIGWYTATVGALAKQVGVNSIVWAGVTLYANPTTTSSSVLWYNASGSSGITSYADNISLRQLLTPGTSGCSIYSTPTLTTNSWASVESGFNWNSATFTVAVKPDPQNLISGTRKPTYVLWKPRDILEAAKNLWSNWKRGAMP